MLLREKCASGFVVPGLRKIKVMRAINFDYQACRGCIEIDNIVTNCLLAIELPTENLFFPKALP